MNGVRGTGSRFKCYTGQDSSHPVYFLLNDQTCAINESLVPVVAIRPAQHVAKVAVDKGTEGAAGVHLGVGSAGSQYSAVAITAGIGDKAGVA